jgi:rod shape-determining protein MreB and related proteins
MAPMQLFLRRAGIDLGTANVLVAIPGVGVVVNEPSVVALSADGRLLAVGAEAEEMLGRTPGEIEARRPLRGGVIADYRLTEALIKHLLGRVQGRVRLIRPEVTVSVPAGISSTERRAVVDATSRAGARNVYLIAEPVAAAIGADVPIGEPTGSLVVDIGGGTTEVALISLGGVVAHASIRVGGDSVDRAITAHLRKKHSLLVGDATAREVKHKIGAALPLPKPLSMKVRGRDLIGGLPKTVTLETDEVAAAVAPELAQIVGAIRSVLEQTPPELASDVIDRGIVLTGGGSLLRGIDTLITSKAGVPAHVAPEPLLCVAKGLAKALENLDQYKRNVAAS